MDVDEWWPKLKKSTRQWLIENNGDTIPANLIVEISEAGGAVDSGFHFSDEVVDWIEATANGEKPEGRAPRE